MSRITVSTLLISLGLLLSACSTSESPSAELGNELPEGAFRVESEAELQAIAEDLRDKAICFYRDADFEGGGSCFPEGLIDSASFNFFDANLNDQVSSIFIGPGVSSSIRVYTGVDFTDNFLDIAASTPYVGNAFNDKISSVRLSGPLEPRPLPANASACFYENVNYRGTTFCYESDTDVDFFEEWKNRISSVQLAPGMSVQLFTGDNLSGDSLELTANTPYIGAKFNDATSSFRLNSP